MAKVKCANCGEPMLEAYTKIGLKMLICGHVKMSAVKGKSGIVRQGEIYCSIDVKGLNASFETLTKGSNLALDDLRQATKQTVSDADLLESANLAIMLGLPPNDLDELFEAARKLGYAVGIDTKKAIQALCRGVGRRSRLILDNIGIVFKAKAAYDWYKELNDLEKLDEIQRTEAWQKYAITLIKEKAEQL